MALKAEQKRARNSSGLMNVMLKVNVRSQLSPSPRHLDIYHRPAMQTFLKYARANVPQLHLMDKSSVERLGKWATRTLRTLESVG